MTTGDPHHVDDDPAEPDTPPTGESVRIVTWGGAVGETGGGGSSFRSDSFHVGRKPRGGFFDRVLGVLLALAFIGALVILATVGLFVGLIALGVIVILAAVRWFILKVGAAPTPADPRRNVRVRGVARQE